MPISALAGGLIGGGISALGSLIGGNAANQSNAKEAHKNREFQKYMSDTAHQREVIDLRAAGLNPILAAGGGGASSPSGSTATYNDVISPAINSAQKARQLQSDLETAKQQQKLLDEQSTKTNQETYTSKSQEQLNIANARESDSRHMLLQEQQKLAREQARNEGARNPGIRFQNELMESQSKLSSLLQPGAQNEADSAKMLGSFGPQAKFWLQFLEKALGGASSAKSLGR